MSTKKGGHIVSLKIVQTSDVHGNFFMRDYVNNHPVKGSLARVYAYVRSLRDRCGDRLLLFDGGDVLQGNPVVYCSNFVMPAEENLASAVMNYMGYDAGVVGNHDIETGHAVYDRWAGECKFPVLGANVIDKDTRSCHFAPYCVLERAGLRVAVLGLTTPAVPNWLPPSLWNGLEFEEMTACAERWMDVIRGQERPDIVVGLFHSGKEGGIVAPGYAENAALDVARKVEGFDVILYGHDHLKNCEMVKGPSGKNVVCCAPSSAAMTVCEVDVEVEVSDDGKRVKSVKGGLTDVSAFEGVEAKYMQRYFGRYIRNTEYYVGQKIGVFSRQICSQDAYFGPSAFVDLVHLAQLEATGAEVSLASPVTFSAIIRKGDVCIRDVFKLYRFDDVLYTMRLKGCELKAALEMSYGLWVNEMKSPDDHVMLLDYVLDGGKRLGFKNLAYNFDSAMGVSYAVDVTRPYGEKISVLQLADGRPFEMDAWYKVVVNSYRGNGGGELLTKGAGIPHEELSGRVLNVTRHNLRDCIVHYIKERGTLDPQPSSTWQLVPQEWAEPACRRERVLLFGHGDKEK